MSFNQLPTELIDQTASFLGFIDICRLRQSQKRMNSILQSYHHTGPAAYEISFNNKVIRLHGEHQIPESIMSAKVHKYPDQLEPGDIQIRTIHGRTEQTNMMIENLAKFKYLHILRLKGIQVDEEFMQRLTGLAVQISYLELNACGLHLNSEQFFQFCQGFGRLSLEWQSLNLTILRDEVLCKNIHKTEFVSDSLITTNCAIINTNTVLSDKILHQMEHHQLPRNIRFDELQTYFTVKTIAGFIEQAIEKNLLNFAWNFGALPKSEQRSARDWRTNINRRMKHLWICKTIGTTGPKYILTQRGNWQHSAFNVVFEVRSN